MDNLQAFREHVLRCYPNEACGYVLNNEFVPCQNVSTEPHQSFQLSPADAIRAESAEYIIHSHTDDYGEDSNVDPRAPSLADMKGQVSTGKPWAIVFCDGSSVTEPVFFGGHTHRPALMNREFVFNANDCLTLAADYMFKEHGIELPALPRNWHWFLDGEDLINQYAENFGFVDVPISEARKSDFLLFAIGTKYINHIGVYLGENKFLHHAHEKTSGIQEVTKYTKHIRRVVRHRSLL